VFLGQLWSLQNIPASGLHGPCLCLNRLITSAPVSGDDWIKLYIRGLCSMVNDIFLCVKKIQTSCTSVSSSSFAARTEPKQYCESRWPLPCLFPLFWCEVTLWHPVGGVLPRLASPFYCSTVFTPNLELILCILVT
jgi:hypothetical protein